MLLGAAAIELTAADRERIDACDELATLDASIRRARTAATREDVFEA